MPTVNAIVRRRVMDLQTEVFNLKKRMKIIEQTFPWDMKRIEIELPDHLRKTYEALQVKSRTAEELATVTGRARAVESAYANMLVTMKLAVKARNGRKIMFSIPAKHSVR